jgi:hypothetical protein
MAQYNLEEFANGKEMNKRLQKAPKFKRGDINMEAYPIEKANVNAYKFLQDELMHEKHQIFAYYYQQGF